MALWEAQLSNKETETNRVKLNILKLVVALGASSFQQDLYHRLYQWKWWLLQEVFLKMYIFQHEVECVNLKSLSHENLQLRSWSFVESYAKPKFSWSV